MRNLLKTCIFNRISLCTILFPAMKMCNCMMIIKNKFYPLLIVKFEYCFLATNKVSAGKLEKKKKKRQKYSNVIMCDVTFKLANWLAVYFMLLQLGSRLPSCVVICNSSSSCFHVKKH